MGRKPTLCKEEQRLFQEAVDGVRPLSSDTIEPTLPALPAIPVQRLRDEAEVMRDIFSDDGFAIEELETGVELLQWRPGLQHQVLKKLRLGHYGGRDPMSCNPCLQWPGAPGISAWTKLRLGWLEPSKVRVVNSGEKAQVSLGPLEEASLQTMVIKIPVTDATYYLVENRQHIGHDRNLPETGVLIMYADDRVAESRYGRGPVRLVNANPIVPHLDSAAFDIDKNASFSDERNGMRIKLLKKNGRSYDILVENAPR